MATTGTTLIESEQHGGLYDLTWTRAIIAHPDHGPVLIEEQFCGFPGGGGTYRWVLAVKLQGGDSLKSLGDIALYSDRSVLDWSESKIAELARSVGL